MKSNYTPIPETQKVLDIPRNDSSHPFDGYPYVYWHFTKLKEKQLDLERAELSGDSLIFRIWITHPSYRRSQPHKLIEIAHDTKKWSANLYSMIVDFDANNLNETITDYEKINVYPEKNDWDFIIDSLFQLKFDILPTDDAIPDYYNDGIGYNNNLPTFSFEFATKDKYRFYQYNDFVRKSEKFWQAGHVLKILDLLNDEFNWFTVTENSLDTLFQKKGNARTRQSMEIYNTFRFDLGAFIPLDNLKNTVGISPAPAIYFGFPFHENYRADLGASLFIPLKKRELEYFLPDTTLTGKADLSGTMGLWVSRMDMLKNNWYFENRLGTGLGIFQTNIPTNKPREENDSVYGSETVFFCIGTGVRKGSFGLSMNYYLVPYNAFSQNLKPDFGKQYLTIGTYFTF